MKASLMKLGHEWKERKESANKRVKGKMVLYELGVSFSLLELSYG